MNYAYDATNNFYCMSEDAVGPGMYRELLVNGYPHLIAVDTETISLKEKIAIGISIAVNPNTSFYFPVFPNPSPVTPWWLLRDPSVKKVFHNSLFDLVALREYDVDFSNVHDTSDLARLLCYPTAELGDLAAIICGMQLRNAKELLTEVHGTTMLDIPVDTVANMCCTHAIATYRIYESMLPEVDRVYYDMEMALVPIMIKMSYRGIKLDQHKRQEVEDKLQLEVDYYRTLCENEGFLPSSPQQVAYMLAKRGAYSVFTRLPFTRSKDGRHRHKNLSTDEATLEKMDDPIAQIVLDYRGKAKLLGTYIKPWRGEDRAYCLSPDTKILHTDLVWRPIIESEIGDSLVGLSGQHQHWYQDASIIEDMRVITDKRYKLVTTEGTIICNGDHQWLCLGVRKYYYNGGSRWTKTSELEPGMKLKYFGNMWETDNSYEAGYLAGIFDGEGWSNRSEVGFSQKPGLVWENSVDLLVDKGFKPNEYKKAGINNLRLYGYDGLRLMGSMRPKRLLKQSGLSWMGKKPSPMKPAIVISIEDIGVGELVGITTSTETFIANGLFTHNTRFHVEAITGRPSSTDRNMQNLPTKAKDNGDCRGMLVPDTGFWTDADLSQAEMRILAYKAQDMEMLHIFSLPKLNPDGSLNVDADIHQQTANFMGIDRKVAKNVGFCMVYGGSAQTIMETAHIRDLRLATSLRADWFRKFPQAGDWIESEQQRVMHDPYVTTILGRRIRLPDPETESDDGLKRKGINYQIQGSAAEILKRSLIKLDSLGWDIALQVHDEVLADGIYTLPDDLADITPVHCPWETKYLARWE